ncbi:MAG: addiction module antitoxin [Desulfobulbaceae bacterium A2]|nr:MAG: addiction module antitoxin [Desulfobulbaceae bacterium A2]
MPTSVALSPHFENYIRQQVASGRYNNVSEVIRAGLRLLEEQETRHAIQLEELRLAITAGLASGPDVADDQVFDRLEAKYDALAKSI